MRIYPLLRSLLFALSRDDAEKAHILTIRLLSHLEERPFILKSIRKIRNLRLQEKSVTLNGIYFPNRIGLAAGFDKNFECIRALSAILGVGFIEGGTVVPQPQSGDPRPRLFRFEREKSLLNHMGFNSEGMEEIHTRLKNYKDSGGFPIPVGISLGKQKTTPLEQAANDYTEIQEELCPYGDYLAVNVSSPNTLGLRTLQKRGFMEGITRAVVESEKTRRKKKGQEPRPIFIKGSPDLNESDRMIWLEALSHGGASGVIWGNTTTNKPDWLTLRYPELSTEPGGFSGPFSAKKTLEGIEQIKRSAPKLTLIGVGGLGNGALAREALNRGADLIQTYAGVVFDGPSSIDDMRRACA